MATIGELLINMKADTTSISKDLKVARDEITQFAEGAKKAFETLGVGLGLGELLIKFRELVTTGVEFGAQMKAMSIESGLSVESMSALAFAAGQSHVDVNALAVGMKKLSVSMLEAGAGSAEFAQYFRVLGINVRDASGVLRPTEAVLADLADKFKILGPGAEASALAVKLFGRSGVELLPLLMKGASGIAELTAKARDLGFVLGSEQADRMEEASQALDRLAAKYKFVAVSISDFLLPKLEVASDYWHNTKWFTDEGFTGSLTENYDNPALHALVSNLEREATAAKAAADAVTRHNLQMKVMQDLARDAAGKGIESIVSKLREEVATLGMSTAALTRYRLAMLGASEGTLKQAAALQLVLDKWNAESAAVARVDAARVNAPDIFGADTARWVKQMGTAHPTLEEIDNDIVKLTHDLTLGDEVLQGWGLGLKQIAPPPDTVTKLYDLDRVMHQFEIHAVDAFAKAIVQGKGFGQVLRQLVQEILEMVAKIVIMESLIKLIPGFGGFAGSTSLGNVLGFAAGGTPTPGVPILVGEQGPEIFFPTTAGTVMPNSVIRGGAGGMTVNNYNDLRGADAAMEARINQRIEEMGRISAQAAFQAYREFSRRTVLGTR